MYWKNCVWSLHAAGSALYLPHWMLGAPSACGPRNALILAANLAGVILVAPIWFISLTVVSTWPHATMTHASAASFGCPTSVRPRTNGFAAGSVLSPASVDAIP